MSSHRPTISVPVVNATVITAKPITVTVLSPASPKEAKKVYTKAEALAVLSRGTPFTLVQPGKSTLIVAWLAGEDGVLGTLYYNAAGDVSGRSEHCIPVHTITDLYLGNLHFPSSTQPDRAPVHLWTR